MVTIDVISSSEVKVEWKSPLGLVEHYSLTLSKVGDIGNTLVTTVSGNSYTYINLESGVEYSFRIESVSASGRSEPVIRTFTTSKCRICNCTTQSPQSQVIFTVRKGPYRNNVGKTFSSFPSIFSTLRKTMFNFLGVMILK